MLAALTVAASHAAKAASTDYGKVPTNIAFGIVAAGMIVCAIRVVTTKNIMHAALYLVVVLGGVGVNYLLLQAEFVAITQFLVYIGAIVVLFLFGIMLTKAPLGNSDDLDNNQKGLAAFVGVALLAVVSYALIKTFRGATIHFSQVPQNNVQKVSDAVFSQYLIPFEIVSVMLLAALIGAIVLARKD